MPAFAGCFSHPFLGSDLSPTETPLSLWDPLKPHQKVHPQNPHGVLAVGGQCQDSAASWIPQEQSLPIYASGKCVF